MVAIEIGLIFVFIIAVISYGVWKSSADAKKQNSSGASGYFLAGRGLTWWFVGFSLIAANISTEQFVGMSGAAANKLGMAIASYEWLSAVALVVVAFVFLPKFLKVGIYTLPEFLEYRYGVAARLAMAILSILILVLVPTSSVIFSGAKFISERYSEVAIVGNLTAMCWFISILAAGYVFVGGLRAAAVTDLIWGVSLIVAGCFVAYFAFQYLGAADPVELVKTATLPDVDVHAVAEASSIERFKLLNAGSAAEGGKLHMVRPIDDPDIPWTSLVMGLWIPIFFYWGLNQYIIQRTLGSKSLAEGQKGIIFAAFMKLIIPFIVVVPGILAYNLFADQLLDSKGVYDYDKAFPVIVKNLIQPHAWLSWFVTAALVGAVISSLASMLNSASTIATMDLYAKATKTTDEKKLVSVGKLFVLIFVVVACLVAPFFDQPQLGGIFRILQEFQGFISPGLLAAFIFGFFAKRAPRFVGFWCLILNAVFYGLLKWWLGPVLCANGLWWTDEISFLDRMAICLVLCCLFALISTLVAPLKEPIKLPVNKEIELKSSKGAKVAGVIVSVLTVILYFIFW